MLRSKLQKKLENAKDYVTKLKKEVLVLYLACKRKDIPWYTKIIPVLVVAYALSPIDFVPDFIPILGYLDDLIIVPLGITLALKLIPKYVLDECRMIAEESFKNGKPRNYFAAAAIVLMWLLLMTLIFLKIMNK
jgi:uncharacterized membrane protein YkvA (DUF1232 family)